jgi:hypothetical protein
VEPNETVIAIVNAGAYSIGSPATATGTINNDDSASTTLQFDFGTATSPVEPSYTQVSHTTVFNAALGYGWQSGTIDSRDRGTGTNLTRDFNFSTDGTFAANVPNGTYTATIIMGDTTTANTHDQMGLSFEGTQVDNITVSGGVTTTRTYTVNVTDGQLNMRIRDLGGIDPYAVIDSLVLQSIATTPSVTVAVAPSSFVQDGVANLINPFRTPPISTSAITINFTLSGTAALNSDDTALNATSYKSAMSAGTIVLPANASREGVELNQLESPSAPEMVEQLREFAVDRFFDLLGADES